MTEAFARADADPATSVVLLRAEGRSFCAGYDIGAQPEGTDDWRSNPTKAHAHLAPQLEFEMAPWLMKKPVVAAVQGHVLGGGCELVMLCDMTIAADNAIFGEPEVRFSAVGPAIVMPMIIGYKKARELLYFGDQIDAKTALDLGMVNRIVPLSAEASAITAPTSRAGTKVPVACTMNPVTVGASAPPRYPPKFWMEPKDAVQWAGAATEARAHDMPLAPAAAPAAPAPPPAAPIASPCNPACNGAASAAARENASP